MIIKRILTIHGEYKIYYEFVILQSYIVPQFAERRTGEITLKIICECKLRLENSPITENELDEFNEKVLAIMEDDSRIQSNNGYPNTLIMNDKC